VISALLDQCRLYHLAVHHVSLAMQAPMQATVIAVSAVANIPKLAGPLAEIVLLEACRFPSTM
jgi:hypothetical protein